MKFWWSRLVPRAFLVVLALVVALLLGVRLYGAHRWNTETRGLLARLDAARAPVRPWTVDYLALIDGLPTVGATVPPPRARQQQ